MTALLRLLLMAGLTLLQTAPAAAEIREEILPFGKFGDLHLYQSVPAPERLIILVSGDGAWNDDAIEMARLAAEKTGALVAGIDITHYLAALEPAPGQCFYPAGEFESLSHQLQTRQHFARYVPPVLMGYSSGGTLVHIILAQAPTNTFAAGMSLGFCPDLTLNQPPCKGLGGMTFSVDPQDPHHYLLDPVPLAAPWVALQGANDPWCGVLRAETFARAAGNGRTVVVPGEDHYFAEPEDWLQQFEQNYRALLRDFDERNAMANTGPLTDLPVIELPVEHSGVDYLALIISGDGGWASLDKSLGEALNAEGVAVVGLNALQYFWDAKDPEGASRDLGRIIGYYSEAWRKAKVLLVGYSLGADVLPFMINRLPPDQRQRVAASALIGASTAVDFQFHVGNWFGDDGGALPVLPEVNRLGNQHLLCIYGADETNESLCPLLDPHMFSVAALPGGHHFDGDYQRLARLIMQHTKSSIGAGNPAGP